MAVEIKNATLRSNVKLDSLQIKTPVAAPAIIDATVEIAASADANSTYTMVRVPTSARISGLSRIYFDDLASSGSGTLDIGFKPVLGNFTADVDALNDGIDVTTAAGSAQVVKGIENHGKMVWEFLGLSADPKGFADVTVTVLDATLNTGGTVSIALLYTVD